MVKYVLTVILLLSAVQAKEFTTKYLSCTLVEEVKNRNVDYITERIAKSRTMFELAVVIKETKFIMPGVWSTSYIKTNGNGYDVYNNSFNQSIYYKNGVRLMIENTIENYAYTRYYDCKKRNPTIKEKAEALKDKWF